MTLWNTCIFINNNEDDGQWLFVMTRPKPPYGRQGLVGSWGKDTVWWVTFQLTSFVPKNVTLPTGGSNCPLLIQKMSCYQQGGPTDLLWSKKRDVTNTGPQLTSFDPKNVTSLTGGSNWPPFIQKRDVTNRGIQLTSFDPKNVMSPIGRSNWPPLIQKTWRH